MNLNVLIGGILFLLWSSFSSWYYVCQIKGLCLNTDVTDQQEEIYTPLEEVDPEPEKPNVEPVNSDEKVSEPDEPVLSPIYIKEDKIYFLKNTTQFVEPERVSKWVEGFENDVEGRSITISIVGHTCDLGRESYNLELGQHRADAMKTFLMQRLNNAQYLTQSKGETESVSGSEELRKLSRKVSITIKSIDQ